ncbi:MAG TPA: hypothetical protein PKY25_03610 [Bacilli bacterium]|nr:hypothetical protein [Bacilli bacterium]
MKEIIIGLEEDFANNNYFGTNLWTEEKFRVLSGDVNILLSAPHSVNQIRNEEVRDAEKFTGGLVRYLSNSTSSYAIFEMFTHADPDYDASHYYKDAVVNLVKQNDIKLLLDIHSSLQTRPYDIDVAINGGINIQSNNNLTEKLVNLGYKYSIKVVIDVIFKADKEQMISNKVAKECNIPCIELEINELYLDPIDNPIKFERLVKFLEEFISYVNYL